MRCPSIAPEGVEAGVFQRDAQDHFAADRAENIYASQALEILYSTRDDELEAIRLLRKYADQGVSFTDCVSFVLMKRCRIATAFTFDHHFERAGFRALGPGETRR